MNLRKFILDALRKKFEGVDEKVLNRIARNAVKTAKSEDEATQFVEDLTIQQVIDGYTDSRVTESISTYEKKYGLKDGKPVDADDNTDDADDKKDKDGNKDQKDDKDKDGKDKKDGDMPAWAQALIDGQTRLNERLDSFEKGKTADVRKSKFLDVIKEAPDKFRERAEKKYARYNFKDDEDFEAYLEELAEEVEEVKSNETGNKGLVTPPKGGSSSQGAYKPSAAMQARAERVKAGTSQSVLRGIPKPASNN